MKTMQALQWDGASLAMATVPVPEPTPGEVLVRLHRAGICNTDLEITRGYYPFHGTLGHEFIGSVETAEETSLIGKRVVADINCACGHCAMCLDGQPHHCSNRHAVGIKGKDGAFAEYLTVPAANLVMVPDDLPDDLAVFAEPLAAALEISEQVDFSPHQAVAVLGDGKLGLLITMTLAMQGLEVSLVGHHPERLALLGLPNVGFHDQPPDRRFPVVVEATGSPAGFADALRLTAPRGTLVLKSTYKEALDFNPSPLVVNEITLLGSRCGPMAKAIDALASGRVDPTALIQARFSLGDGLRAFERACTRGVLKVLLEMG